MSARSLFTVNSETSLLSAQESKYFVINAEERTITPPASFKNFGVTSDENSKRVYFECPRVVGDNLDLTTLALRINFQNAKGEKDSYIVEDVTIDGDLIHFSWLLSRKCTRYNGALIFIVCAVKTDAEGVIKNEWNTTTCSGSVLTGLEVDAPEIPEDTTDLVSQLLDIVNSSIESAQDAAAETLEIIKTAEAEALDNIAASLDPTLKESGKAADAKAVGDELETKADALICSAAGFSIVVSDSAESTLKGLTVYGKTTQDGTPTPDAPIDLVSVESPTVSVYGRNLVDIDSMLNDQLIKNTDGTYTLTKNGTGSLRFSARFECNLPKGVYSLSVGNVSGTEETVRVALTYSNGSEAAIVVPKIINAEDSIVKIGLYIPADREDGAYTTFSNLVLMSGEAVAEYEPYKEEQSLALPYSLHGIPVDSGGNYTDEQGQQWICDEVDLERGVYVQRVYSYAVTGSEIMHDNGLDEVAEAGNIRVEINGLNLPQPISENNIGLCTHYNYRVTNKTPISCWVHDHVNTGYGRLRFVETLVNFPTLADFISFAKAQYDAGKPITIFYAILTPLETALTEDEIADYKTLLTNAPNTTLLNSHNAYMALKYAADIDKYISGHYVPLSQYLALEERVAALEGVQ